MASHGKCECVFVCLVPLGGQAMVPTLTGFNCVEAGVSDPALVRTDVWAEAATNAAVEGKATL